MSKIVFFCIPAHGHTNPTLGVVRELVRRGHQVWYYSYMPFREKIEACGARFISCDEYDCEQKLSPEDAKRLGKDLALSTKVLVNTTLALDEVCCRQLEEFQPDCIVADSMAVWGKVIAMKLGIPLVSSTTTFAFNRYSAGIMKQSFGDLIRMVLSMPSINKDLKRLQQKGYPVKSILDIIGNDNDTNTIVYTSPEFQPFSETFSDKYSFVGPSIREATQTVAKNKEKLVYIALGTVLNDQLPFYRNCISAFADSGYQVIMSVGNSVRAEDLGEIPVNFTVCGSVDQIAVLQCADAFLTHCGMNSVNESLYCCVPMILFPQTTEEAGVATRVEQVGAGIRLCKSTPKAIREAAEQVLGDARYREKAAAVSEGFRKCPGAAGAADKIEQLCGSK